MVLIMFAAVLGAMLGAHLFVAIYGLRVRDPKFFIIGVMGAAVGLLSVIAQCRYMGTPQAPPRRNG